MPEMSTPENKRHLQLNCIAAKVELFQMPVELEGYLNGLEELKNYYSKTSYPLPQCGHYYFSSLQICRAKCLYLLGRYEEAEACLDEKGKYFVNTADSLLLYGDIALAKNHSDLARDYWSKGLKLADGGYVMKQLNKRLTHPRA